MTREEAKKELNEYGYTISEQNKIIDDIYDYFENRSCKDCKFGITYLFDDEIECFKIEADTQGIYFASDFCCNKWEKNES